VLQPDVVLAVGMLRARTAAELALLHHRWFTPHTWTIDALLSHSPPAPC
jgi:L-alanine-DL-glutamate epimerase-like enolase superfamily enzyme